MLRVLFCSLLSYIFSSYLPFILICLVFHNLYHLHLLVFCFYIRPVKSRLVSFWLVFCHFLLSCLISFDFILTCLTLSHLVLFSFSFCHIYIRVCFVLFSLVLSCFVWSDLIASWFSSSLSDLVSSRSSRLESITNILSSNVCCISRSLASAPEKLQLFARCWENWKFALKMFYWCRILRTSSVQPVHVSSFLSPPPAPDGSLTSAPSSFCAFSFLFFLLFFFSSLHFLYLSSLIDSSNSDAAVTTNTGVN